MDRAELKRLKEDFVSNLEGTTKWEIFCIIGCLPLCLLFAAAAEHWVQSRLKAADYGGSVIRLASFLVEFIILVLPQVATSMSDAPAEIFFLIVLLIWGMVSLKVWQKVSQSAGAKAHLQHQLQQLAEPRKRFVSTFRGGIMLYTCIGILAVDFHAFPRRYAKAENFGQGLMDIGVGAIVFAGGMSSKAAHREALRGAALHVRALRALRSSAPLLVLGGARLATTLAAGYQEHVGEYGVHWNFFFTVAAVSALTLLVWVPERLLAPAGLAVTALHQAVLTLSGVGAWVQSPERGAGLLEANKEGISSLWGYWALHLLGAAAGNLVRGSCSSAVARARARLQSSSRGQAVQAADAAQALWMWVAWLAAVDGGLWAASWAAEHFVEPVSRRACNMAYVLWVAALCLATLILCLATELLLPAPPGRAAAPPLQLLSAINRNMLSLFLAANLLTGGVNMAINTLAVGAWAARGIVGAYMLLVCSLAWRLDASGITIKYW